MNYFMVVLLLLRVKSREVPSGAMAQKGECVLSPMISGGRGKATTWYFWPVRPS